MFPPSSRPRSPGRVTASPRTSARLERRRTRLAVAWFSLSAVALVWPTFHWLGNYARPFVLGIPWSLAYVLTMVVANFVVLMALYRAGWIDASEPERSGDEDVAERDATP